MATPRERARRAIAVVVIDRSLSYAMSPLGPLVEHRHIRPCLIWTSDDRPRPSRGVFWRRSRTTPQTASCQPYYRYPLIRPLNLRLN